MASKICPDASAGPAHLLETSSLWPWQGTQPCSFNRIQVQPLQLYRDAGITAVVQAEQLLAESASG